MPYSVGSNTTWGLLELPEPSIEPQVQGGLLIIMTQDMLWKGTMVKVKKNWNTPTSVRDEGVFDEQKEVNSLGMAIHRWRNRTGSYHMINASGKCWTRAISWGLHWRSSGTPRHSGVRAVGQSCSQGSRIPLTLLALTEMFIKDKTRCFQVWFPGTSEAWLLIPISAPSVTRGIVIYSLLFSWDTLGHVSMAMSLALCPLYGV